MSTRRGSALVAASLAAALWFVLLPGFGTGTDPVGSASAAAATTSCQHFATIPVDGGFYNVQTNEWNSTATQCVSTDGNADFSIVHSSVSTGTTTPGSYPSIYRGCHWGVCTRSSGFPVQAERLGDPTSSWSIVQPRAGRYDVAYDVWFNRAPSTSSQPNAAELMIWLDHSAGVQPAGSPIGVASVDGHRFRIWFTSSPGRNYVAYEMVGSVTSVKALDIGAIVRNAESRSYITPTWYVIDVEAGFEIWSGEAGLATTSFSLHPSHPSTPVTGPHRLGLHPPKS